MIYGNLLNLIIIIIVITNFTCLFMPTLAPPPPPFATNPSLLSADNFNSGIINAFPPAGLRHRFRLRDFIETKKRGKGSISRLSLDGTDSLQLPDPDLGSGTGTDVPNGDNANDVKLETPKFQPFKIVMPPNMGKTEKGDRVATKKNNSSTEQQRPKSVAEDYEKLAKILEQFLSQRNQKSSLKKMEQKSPNNEHINVNEADRIGGGQQQDLGTDMATKWDRNRASLKNGNATGRTAIGTTVSGVSVEISSDKERGNCDAHALLTAAAADGMHRVEMINHRHHNHPLRGIQKIDKKDKEIQQEKLTITDAKNWDGSVEMVTTLRMGSSSAAPSSNLASLVDADHHHNKTVKNDQQQKSVEKQLLGRIIIEPHKSMLTDQGKIGLNDDDGQSLFYHVQPAAENGVNSENANVQILREGFARQIGTADYVFVASITLIRDGGKTILVDTGIGTDINGRTDMLKKLTQHNIAPPAVDYVVITHGHPDHSGNTNDFPDAIHFQGVMSHHRTKFNFSNLFDNFKHQLTENVALISTPGHTSEDISVIVKNAQHYGTVVVAGDAFIASEDLTRPMMWRPLASDETLQEQSRHMILCMANYVVPGHGKMFHVNAQMRSQANCSMKDL